MDGMQEISERQDIRAVYDTTGASHLPEGVSYNGPGWELVGCGFTINIYSFRSTDRARSQKLYTKLGNLLNGRQINLV